MTALIFATRYWINILIYIENVVDYYGITDETSCEVSRETICPLCKLGRNDEEIEGRYKTGSYFIKCEREIEITA
jgi:hypothetical protein